MKCTSPVHNCLAALASAVAGHRLHAAAARNLLIASLLVTCAPVSFAQFSAARTSATTDFSSTVATPPAGNTDGDESSLQTSTGVSFGGGSNTGSSFDGDDTLQQASETIWRGNNGPEATIIGGDKTIPDTDSVLGETVTLAATATDFEGPITTTEWIINGNVVANGTSAEIGLNDGTTVITFRVTDDHGSSSIEAVTYIVVPPAFQLLRIGGVNTEQLVRDSEFSISVRDLNNFLVATAPITQSFDMTGFIFPQAIDLSATADIFVVAATPSGLLMRDTAGSFVPWNGDFTSLVPAYEARLLTSQVRVNIYTGSLPAPGTYRLYVAYMRTDGTELIYSVDGRVLNVTAQ